jgi:hypothetical protein
MAFKYKCQLLRCENHLRNENCTSQILHVFMIRKVHCCKFRVMNFLPKLLFLLFKKFGPLSISLQFWFTFGFGLLEMLVASLALYHMCFYNEFFLFVIRLSAFLQDYSSIRKCNIRRPFNMSSAKHGAGNLCTIQTITQRFWSHSGLWHMQASHETNVMFLHVKGVRDWYLYCGHLSITNKY